MLISREAIETFYNGLMQRIESVRGNWGQNDPTAPDYIKNKPNEDDALNIAILAGIISPAVADDKSIYTDENGILYTL